MILFASRYHRLLMCTISSASAVILDVMWYIISFEFYIVFFVGVLPVIETIVQRCQSMWLIHRILKGIEY